MKQKFLLLFMLTTSAFAKIENINSFEADFTQKIVDDKNKTILYKGHIDAIKPQYALWHYSSPVKKSVYIVMNKVVIIEPDLEQAIIKKIASDFDFFNLIKHAKKIAKNEYVTHYNSTKYHIKIDKDTIQSIQYKDEFDNNITIIFNHQITNKKIDKKLFQPIIPDDYDIVRG